MRVLICDDNEDAAQTLAMLISTTPARHEVRHCYDGHVCLAEARSFQIAVVDIGMPGLDGYAVARSLRAERGADIFLIAFTGWAAAAHQQAAIDAGFDLHSSKTELDPLLATVEERGAPGHAN